MINELTQKNKTYKQNILRIIGVSLYIISFFYIDALCLIPLIGIWLLILLYSSPFNMSSSKRASLFKPKKISLILIIVVIIFELISSYLLRVYLEDIFFLGRIELGGIELINSFVLLVEMGFVVIYYIAIYRDNPIKINKKVLIWGVVILLPFIFHDTTSVAYKLLVRHETADSLQSLELSYRAFILAALFEELFYRGMLYDEFKNHMRPVYANLLQSFIFMIAHSQRWIMLFESFDLYVLLNLLVVFSLGFMSAMIRDKFNSLIPSVLLHGSLNNGVYAMMLFVGKQLLN